MPLVDVQSVYKSYPHRTGLRTAMRPVVVTGEAEALCSAPRMPYTQRLLGAMPELPP